MPILKTENITRIFKSGGKKIYALNDVSIQAKPECLTILRGRSGSGKTTLINELGALDKPTKGKVFFKEIELSNISERKRDDIRRCEMGFVFQSVALISLMSAYENIEFGLRVAGYPTGERKKRAVECLNLVGLGKRISHRPHELSGGEQQRVAIARAFAHKPKIVFADEPTAELDTKTGLKVVKLFKTLIEQEKITVIMTTHDPAMMELADHVYTLEDGGIIDEF